MRVLDILFFDDCHEQCCLLLGSWSSDSTDTAPGNYTSTPSPSAGSGEATPLPPSQGKYEGIEKSNFN